MGIPSMSPTDAAPPYDDVINNHPVNRYPPTGSTSGYTTIPSEDVEQALDVDDHAHAHTPLVPSQQPETFTQTVARLLLPKADTPHTHCATCDEQVQTAARQKREDDRYYCTMVTVTFLTLFVCGMLLGVVIVAANAKRARGSGS
ncbi:hypothetical protein yc1106_02164 [Curvularia clavata]|uniref:LITAF domain-containing protein n=1 Tax=Curvularia clavata TaxID=95742 RepID=A0A9Q9DQ96_CURCL|nr:hypothetical protein yc1106_02164 [Curvularia clavata]